LELKNFFAQDDQGNRLPGATCYLYQRGTESLVAGLVRVNGTMLPNPFVTDESGLAQFAAANGLYDLRVTTPTRDLRIPIQFNDVGENVAAAQLAAVQAESARDAAQLSAGVYPTIAAGLAATSNGNYFTVPSAEADEFLILYKNSSNVAIETKRYPNTKAVSDALSSTVQSFTTAAAMRANLKLAQGLSAIVTNDPDPLNNGWYTKVGAPNTGSWSPFPDQPTTTSALNVAELAAASAAVTTDLTFSSTWSADANNGGVVTHRYGRPSGIRVPAASNGYLTYLTAMFAPANVGIANLVGSTVQAVITGRLTGDFGGLITLRSDRAFRAVRPSGTVNVGRVVSETYASGTFKRVVQYTVTAEDTQLGIILSAANGPVATATSTLVVDRVSFGVVAAAQRMTPYSAANVERSKLFNEVNASAGLSWRWQPATFDSGYASFLNGAIAVPLGATAPNLAGMQIPVGMSGAGSYFYNLMKLDADQVKALAGSTVRLVAKFTATADALDLLDLQFVPGMRAARGAADSVTVDAKLVELTQDGLIITKVVDYVVDATDVAWAVNLGVHANAVQVSQAITLQFKSLTWSVGESGQANKRAADVALTARFAELVKPVDQKMDAQSAALRISSGDVLGRAVVTGSGDGNGAVLARENGVIVGFDIPAGRTGAGVYNRVLIPFDAATRAAIVGKTIRMTLEADVSATFAVDKLLRKDRAIYVDGVIGNVGTLVSETFKGTRYTRVVEYLVAEGAVTFGPVVSYVGVAVSANANSFRLRSLRWQVAEVNGDGQSAQDFMFERRMASQSIGVSPSDNVTGALKVSGSKLDTTSVIGFSPIIQPYSVSKLGGVVNTIEQVVAIDPPATEQVTAFEISLIYATATATVPGARLPHQYTSARVVKRVSDGVELVEGVDYAVKPNTCYIYGLKDIASTPCLITYTGHLHRYDLVSLNLTTGVLVVTKGTGRAIDPEEYKPALPVGHVRLNELYVYPAGVDVLQTWRYRELRDQLAGQAYDEWLTYCRSVLPKTMAKLRRGQRIKLIGYGSSSVDMGGGALYPLEPNRNRDLTSFFDRIPADTRAKYPTFNNTDPDFAWSSASNHIKYGFMWQLIGAMRERWGADVEYRNWGVGATTSAATIENGSMNGAYPDRLNAMLADQGDLMVLAFANGLGGDWWYSTHRTIIEAFKAQGGEVIVLTSPRLNIYGEGSVGDTTWKKSHDDLIRVALDTGCAYVPTNLIEGPGREGNTGLSHRNLTNANLYNHGGPIQLGNTGKLMAMIIP
jgi:hypothetical protein